MTQCAEDFWPVTELSVSTHDPLLSQTCSTSIDWKTCWAQERARAEAAEARCEELRWAEVDARTQAGSYKAQCHRSSEKLKAAREEVKQVRRTAKHTLALEAEVERLRTLLRDAGVDRRKRATVTSLRMDVARLRDELGTQKQKNRQLEKQKAALEEQKAALENEVAALRSTRSVLSGALYGSRSERQKKPKSTRSRGQQQGKPGHGRTARPDLETKEERHDPPADASVCPCCGAPYVANGDRVSELIEIEVKAHVRRILRGRRRKSCDCDGVPGEVIAPPPPRLFAGTPFGISVWARYLLERYASHRPCRRVAAWLTDHGLKVAPGTLAGSTDRFLALFEPLADAILIHQNQATIRHADETSWRIQALGRNGGSQRAWLWTSVSTDAVFFHIDPSRSAEAAGRLFAGILAPVFLVCDRFSAYKKLARDLAGMVILCTCWVHCRRDYIKCAAGHDHLAPWRDQWIVRIGEIYHLNKARLQHWTPDGDTQTAAFETAQTALKSAVDELFAQAERERADLPEDARQVQPLRSMIEHREGLTLFLEHPQIPMDNNCAEVSHRFGVIARKLCFGSDSLNGARLTAVMYSVLATMEKNGLDVHRWLSEWLAACAGNGRSPPGDLEDWLPWTMSEERRRALIRPG